MTKQTGLTLNLTITGNGVAYKVEEQLNVEQIESVFYVKAVDESYFFKGEGWTQEAAVLNWVKENLSTK